MERTLVIHTDGKEIEIPVKASMGALQTYRAQFAADLIKDLNEVHGKLHPDPFMDAIKRAGIKPGQLDQEEITSAILANVDYSQLSDEKTLPDGETQLKTLQIVWAMAKSAAGSTKRFDLWCDDFELLPIRELADSCYEVWAEAGTGTVELKN